VRGKRTPLSLCPDRGSATPTLFDPAGVGCGGGVSTPHCAALVRGYKRKAPTVLAEARFLSCTKVGYLYFPPKIGIFFDVAMKKGVKLQIFYNSIDFGNINKNGNARL
jgi:hypothetical protein